MTPLPRLFAVPLLVLGLALLMPATSLAQETVPAFTSSVIEDELPMGKQTQAGLYITAAEAADLLEMRDDILLIDVRTPEETILVGHATETDANIPIAFFDPNHTFNVDRGTYVMVPNSAFATATLAYLEGRSPAAVFTICRSGGRSARAVDILMNAGVDLPLYSVVDGFEGDKNPDGQRKVNGWKNAGGPWTYKPREGLLLKLP